jgi:hypothetical protein
VLGAPPDPPTLRPAVPAPPPTESPEPEFPPLPRPEAPPLGCSPPSPAMAVEVTPAPDPGHVSVSAHERSGLPQLVTGSAQAEKVAQAPTKRASRFLNGSSFSQRCSRSSAPVPISRSRRRRGARSFASHDEARVWLERKSDGCAPRVLINKRRNHDSRGRLWLGGQNRVPDDRIHGVELRQSRKSRAVCVNQRGFAWGFPIPAAATFQSATAWRYRFPLARST